MRNLNKQELEELVRLWFKYLDTHAPLAKVAAMISKQGLVMKFPETTIKNSVQFNNWYKRVVRVYFDETHFLKLIKIKIKGPRAYVTVLVNWRAHTWQAPEPYSQWINFDVTQTWQVVRDPVTQRPVIKKYAVKKLKAQ